MMEGITVLNTIKHTITAFTWTPLAVILAVIIVVLVIGGFVLAIKENFFEFFLLSLLISIFPFFLCLIAGDTPIGTYNTYEVIIDETVSMKEFNERYIVIEQQEQIYEIKERPIETEADSN